MNELTPKHIAPEDHTFPHERDVVNHFRIVSKTHGDIGPGGPMSHSDVLAIAKRVTRLHGEVRIVPNPAPPELGGQG